MTKRACPPPPKRTRTQVRTRILSALARCDSGVAHVAIEYIYFCFRTGAGTGGSNFGTGGGMGGSKAAEARLKNPFPLYRSFFMSKANWLHRPKWYHYTAVLDDQGLTPPRKLGFLVDDYSARLLRKKKPQGD